MVSAGGNIGIASAETEDTAKIVFERQDPAIVTGEPLILSLVFTPTSGARALPKLFQYFTQQVGGMEKAMGEENQQSRESESRSPIVLQSMEVTLGPEASFGISEVLKVTISPEITFVLIPSEESQRRN